MRTCSAPVRLPFACRAETEPQRQNCKAQGRLLVMPFESCRMIAFAVRLVNPPDFGSSCAARSTEGGRRHAQGSAGSRTHDTPRGCATLLSGSVWLRMRLSADANLFSTLRTCVCCLLLPRGHSAMHALVRWIVSRLVLLTWCSIMGYALALSAFDVWI